MEPSSTTIKSLFGDDSDSDSDSSSSSGDNDNNNNNDDDDDSSSSLDEDRTKTKTKTLKRRKLYQKQKQLSRQNVDRGNSTDHNEKEEVNRNNNNNIGVYDNVLTLEECDELIAVHESEPHNGYVNQLTVTRVSDLVASSEGGAAAVHLVLPLVRARYKMWQLVERHFPNETLELMPEFTSLTAWHRGSFLRNHYDSNREYLQDRHYSAILYLNDPTAATAVNSTDTDTDTDENSGAYAHRHHHPKNYHRNGFEGGDLVFEFPPTPTAEISSSETKAITPKAGRFVCFPSSSQYVHRVNEITIGTRYALTMWFTKHWDSMEHLQSLQQQQQHGSMQQHRSNRGIVSASSPKELLLTAPQHHQQHPPQPWETSEQAQILQERTLLRAELPLHQQQQSRDDACKDTTTSTSADSTASSKDSPSSILSKELVSSLSETELRHLIAYCWWKKGVPLGSLLDPSAATATTATATTKSVGDNAIGSKECMNIHNEWKDKYVRQRLQGLACAFERWKNDGMLITNVKDEEMHNNVVEH